MVHVKGLGLNLDQNQDRKIDYNFYTLLSVIYIILTYFVQNNNN